MKVLLNEPEGEIYKTLIAYAFEVCNEFLFIKHSQLFYLQSFDILIDDLNEAYICCKEQHDWPGTRSVPTAMVYYFRNTEKAKERICNVTNSLFDWCAPYLPDDLCFLKNNKPWLITTAHEQSCYIETDDIKEIEGLKRINRLVYKIQS